MAEGAFGAGANGGLDADGLAKMKAGSRSQLLRSADAGTLLQALQAGSDGADVPFAPEGGEDVAAAAGGRRAAPWSASRCRWRSSSARASTRCRRSRRRRSRGSSATR